MTNLRSKLARAVIAGFFTPEEAEAVAELVEFHNGDQRELPIRLQEEFAMLMRANNGSVQVLRPPRGAA